jgi:MFS family permease
MIIGGACFFAGAVLMSASVHIAMLVIGRVCLGIGVGICVQCGPLFLSELAPAHLRGLFNTQFQLFITFGILVAQVINYLTQNLVIGWRLSLGLAGVPALLLLLGCLAVPETPNSLVSGEWDRGGIEARALLRCGRQRLCVCRTLPAAAGLSHIRSTCS